jgi:uncharacterized protein YacL
MNNLHIARTGYIVGGLSIVFFILCMIWGTILTDPTLKELHLNILKITYPGFTMSAVGFVIGVVESFVYGFVFGVLFAWLCKVVCVSRGNE